MEIVHERCCGLDVHAKTVLACLILPGPTGKPTKEIRVVQGRCLSYGVAPLTDPWWSF